MHRPRQARFAIIVSLCGLSVAGPSAARATSYCEIAKTGDGFVALRDSPSAKSAMLERMIPGDEVLIGQKRSGSWLEVVFWRGGRFHSGKHPEGDPPTARGWMRETLIAADSCG